MEFGSNPALRISEVAILTRSHWNLRTAWRFKVFESYRNNRMGVLYFLWSFSALAWPCRIRIITNKPTFWHQPTSSYVSGIVSVSKVQASERWSLPTTKGIVAKLQRPTSERWGEIAVILTSLGEIFLSWDLKYNYQVKTSRIAQVCASFSKGRCASHLWNVFHLGRWQDGMKIVFVNAPIGGNLIGGVHER